MKGGGLKLNIWPEAKNTKKFFEKDT
jgi:hypothetical protein